MRLFPFRAVLTGVAVLTVVSVAVPAQAITVSPSTRTFGALIDAPASWERESGCDQTEKKGPKKLRKLLNATYGARYSNILRACTAADSGHEEGRALDWMINARVPEEKAVADGFLTWLQTPDEFGNPSAMARRLGLSYVIWNNQMWRPSTGLSTPYSDCMLPKKRFKKFDNTCHRNHVHVSFSWDGALGRTSYYTGFVSCAAPVVAPWVPAILPAAPEVVPVTATRVLDTRTGAGLANGPCRAHPDVRLDVPVLGGEVPLTGVAAVTLTVTVTRVDAPTQLRVWVAGSAEPLDPQGSADKGLPGTATVTVPVGPEGLVSVELTGGMGHVAVDVTGYSVAAPA